MITQFKDEYRWLSNFWRVLIIYGKLGYDSVEHFYQAMKFLDENTRRTIAMQVSPGKAKWAARMLSASVRPNWQNISLFVMEYGLRVKFSNPDLRTRLMETHPQILVEGNYWHDNFYGDCFCPKCANIQGENNLGKLLMKIRQECVDFPDKELFIPDWKF